MYSPLWRYLLFAHGLVARAAEPTRPPFASMGIRGQACCETKGTRGSSSCLQQAIIIFDPFHVLRLRSENRLGRSVETVFREGWLTLFVVAGPTPRPLVDPARTPRAAHAPASYHGPRPATNVTVCDFSARSMKLQTLYRCTHVTVSAHRRHAVFCERVRGPRSRDFSARARIASRSGARARVGTASMTVKRLFNGESRGRSQAKVLEGHPALRHWKWRQWILRRGTLPFANASDSCDGTYGDTHTELVRVPI
jgi:hypothetical protein